MEIYSNSSLLRNIIRQEISNLRSNSTQPNQNPLYTFPRNTLEELLKQNLLEKIPRTLKMFPTHSKETY